MKLFFSGICLILSLNLFAQKVTYAELMEEDVAEVHFEILGKTGGYTVIYKNHKNNHRLTYYNDRMDVVKDLKLDMLPAKTKDVDFVIYPDRLVMIYQYRQDKKAICEARTINAFGEVSVNPQLLETAPGGSGDGRVFNISVSNDKQQILVYKMHRSGDSLQWSNRLFDATLEIKEISHFKLEYKKERDAFTDVLVSNNGTLGIAFSHAAGRREKYAAVWVYVKPAVTDTLLAYNITSSGIYIDEIIAKTDNLNNRFAFTALYAPQPKGKVAGLYAAVVDFGNLDVAPHVSVLAFSDNLRNEFNTSRAKKSAFEEMSLKQLVIKSSGGILITAEENLVARTGQRYNRYDNYYNNSPYARYDYYNYMYNPGFYRPYYRGYPGSYYYPNARNDFEYISNNILMISLDASLKTEWDAVITKNQRAFLSDQSVSFGDMNSGGLFHFLYTVQKKNYQSLGHSAVSPAGALNKYSDFIEKNRNKDFMPRYARQIGSASMIIPYQVSNRIGFALIEF